MKMITSLTGLSIIWVLSTVSFAQNQAVEITLTLENPISIEENFIIFDIVTENDRAQYTVFKKILILQSKEVVQKKGDVVIDGIRYIRVSEDQRKVSFGLSGSSFLKPDGCEFQIHLGDEGGTLECDLTGSCSPAKALGEGCKQAISGTIVSCDCK